MEGVLLYIGLVKPLFVRLLVLDLPLPRRALDYDSFFFISDTGTLCHRRGAICRRQDYFRFALSYSLFPLYSICA